MLEEVVKLHKMKNNLDPKKLEKDINRLMNFLDKLEDEDLDKLNLEELEEEAKEIQESIESKYKNIQENLDTEE